MLKQHGIKFYTSENERFKSCRRGTIKPNAEGKKCFVILTTKILVATRMSWKTYCIHTITCIIGRLECPHLK